MWCHLCLSADPFSVPHFLCLQRPLRYLFFILLPLFGASPFIVHRVYHIILLPIIPSALRWLFVFYDTISMTNTLFFFSFFFTRITQLSFLNSLRWLYGILYMGLSRTKHVSSFFLPPSSIRPRYGSDSFFYPVQHYKRHIPVISTALVPLFCSYSDHICHTFYPQSDFISELPEHCIFHWFLTWVLWPFGILQHLDTLLS